MTRSKAPPTKKDLLAKLTKYSKQSVDEVLALLVQESKLERVTEDLYFTTASLEKLENDLVDFLKAKGEIDAQGFKELTGLTRKFSIPLMEYFDKKKVTIRVENKRVLRG